MRGYNQDVQRSRESWSKNGVSRISYVQKMRLLNRRNLHGVLLVPPNAKKLIRGTCKMQKSFSFKNGGEIPSSVA